jgi:ankyrin repeat protein
MAPPCLPAQPYQFSWQPYIIENWFVEHGTYKEWLTGPGIGVLHAHGDSHMATKSQVLYSQLQGREHVPNMMYFEFRRHDSRFNSLEAMLKTFIAHIMTRVPQRNGTRDDYSAMMPLIFHYQAMSLTDLMHIFRTMLMWRHIPPLVFMIACFDECDRNKYRLLGLIYSIREFTEMRHRFIITSLAEERLMSRLAGNYSINLEDFNDVNDRPAWTDTFEKTYEIQLNLLTDGRPVFRSFMPHIREILASCGTDYRLGHLIIRWLLNKKTNPGRDTKAYAESVLDSLEPVTAENVLSTILHAFGPDVDRARIYLDWVTVAARPLTLIELGTAVDFTEDPTSDALSFVDFQNIRSEVERFGLVFAITDNVVDLWLPYYQERTHYDEADVERAHGRIAAACLEYLLLDVTQTLSWEFYGRFPDPEGVVPFSPKDSLLSYAVQFWTHHYSKAGEKKPFGKAQEFFQHVEARNTWWAMLQLLTPPILRVYWSFLSPLPMVASTGLDDLLEAQLKIESDSSTLKKDAGIALIQAARNGHKFTMALVKDHAEITKELLTDLINEAAGEESPECVEEVVRLASSSSLVVEATPIDICRTVWVGWKEIAENLYNSAKEQERELDFRSELHPLHLAVEHGDEALVEMVIDWIDDINTRDKWGRTALHLAATVGDPGVIRLLLAKGADIEAEFAVEDRGSLTSLQLATASGNHLAMDVLLQNDAKVNIGANELIGGIGSFHEAPPIIYAAGMGFIKCVEVLLQHKADLTVTVSNCSALWYAVEGGRVDIARLLLEAGAKPTDNPDKLEMLLFLPIRAQNMEMLDLLLDHDADVNGESSWDTMSRTPLARAAAGGDLEIVKKLLEKGAKPDLVGTDSQSPLYLAAYEEHPEVAYLLLEKDVDVNRAVEATKWTPLHAAYDNKELVERLLKEGANIDALSDSGTVLYLAAKHNEWEVVELLIEKKANLEIATQRISDDLPKEEFDMTPLCVACLKGNSGVVRSLLLAGANANHVCKDEDTGDDLTFPLKICLDEYWDGVVDVILEPRPGISTRPDLKLSANGNTVLHSIRTSTSLPAVKSLIGAGADIEAFNKAGATALIVALDCNNFDVAEYLITQGANVNHYSADHGTPLHVTCRTADAVLFKALISRGADVKRADSSGYHSTLLGVLASTGEDWDKMQDIAKHLLEEAQIDPNAKCRKQPWYPLCRAAWEPTDELVTYLIEKGADVNVEDAWGLKPLHFASWYSWDMHNIIRNAEGLKDPWPLNKVKMSPLHYSANGRIWNDGFDELLSKVGASVDDKDADGWDAVMWSAKANYDEPEVIEAIVKRARDDALWDKGYVTSERLWSPLKCATYYGSMERVYNALTPPEDKRTRKLESGEEEVWDDDAHKSREADFKDTRCNLCLGVST